jgi:ribosomal protein L4
METKIETKIHNQRGEEVGKINLPAEVFGLPWNSNLVHGVVVSMMSSSRDPIAHTKTRGGRPAHTAVRAPSMAPDWR